MILILSLSKEKQYSVDPKPDELALARLNFAEMRREDRTGGLFNTFG